MCCWASRRTAVTSDARSTRVPMAEHPVASFDFESATAKQTTFQVAPCRCWAGLATWTVFSKTVAHSPAPSINRPPCKIPRRVQNDNLCRAAQRHASAARVSSSVTSVCYVAASNSEFSSEQAYLFIMDNVGNQLPENLEDDTIPHISQLLAILLKPYPVA
jgi:hypothetical protein